MAHEDSIASVLGSAQQHHRAGRFSQAAALYQEVLRRAPDHVEALQGFGWMAYELGKTDLAVELMRRAVSAQPSTSVHFHLALVLQSKGNVSGAIQHYQKALSLNPEFPEALLNLGGLLKVQGKPDAAAELYERALALRPTFAEAHSNLGNALVARGRVEEAVRSYRKALAIRPDYADAQLNLGEALYAQGEYEAAAQSYQRAIEIDPTDAEAYNGLTRVLLAHGQAVNALRAAEQSLRIRETNEAKGLIVRCLDDPAVRGEAARLRHLLTRAICEPWCRPGQVAAAAATVIMSDPGLGPCIQRAAAAWPRRLSEKELFGNDGLRSASNEPLLMALLENAPVCGVAMERFLAMARTTLLAAAEAQSADVLAPETLAFYCSLARQCFVNEYIFSCSEEEADRARSLRDRLVEALKSGRPVPAVWLVAAAAYFPLLTLTHIERVLDRPWPEAVGALLTQQVREPREESRYAEAIPRLTALEEGLSRLVQRQYEENPYPRWVRAEPAGRKLTLQEFLAREFPFAPCRHLRGEGEGLDVLIAGCGTGQQSIQTAQAFMGARILAIDLSMSSLGYATRKTAELGLENIRYAQADILKLGSIAETFDLIECVGVLHHLADPVAGWRELLRLLRPGGFMHLGLYSEPARQDIAAAQRFVAERGYAVTPDGIRRCREDLVAAGARFERVTKIDDFCVTSGCRDLLFHVKEHSFTLAAIKQCLADLDLQFIGFKIGPHILRKYRERFPDDRANTNLDHWQRFESENSNTFIGMYNFYVQRRS